MKDVKKTNLFETRLFTTSEKLMNDLLSAFHSQESTEVRSKWNNYFGVTLRLMYFADTEMFIIGYEPTLPNEVTHPIPVSGIFNYVTETQAGIESTYRTFKLEDYGDDNALFVWLKSVLLAWEGEVEYIDEIYHDDTTIKRSQFRTLLNAVKEEEEVKLDSWYIDVPGRGLAKSELMYEPDTYQLKVYTKQPDVEEAIENEELSYTIIETSKEGTLDNIREAKLASLISEAILWWNATSHNK